MRIPMLKYSLQQPVRIMVGQYKGWTGRVHSTYSIAGMSVYQVVPTGRTQSIEYQEIELTPLDDRE